MQGKIEDQCIIPISGGSSFIASVCVYNSY